MKMGREGGGGVLTATMERLDHKKDRKGKQK